MIAGVKIHLIASIIDGMNFQEHFEYFKQTLFYLNQGCSTHSKNSISIRAGKNEGPLYFDI